MAVTGLGVTSRVAYTDKQGYYEDLLQQAKEDNGNDGFYRVEDSGRKTKNDDSLYGYRSATIFSSLMNLDVSHLFQSLYMEGKKFLLLQWCFSASVSHVFGEIYAFL